MQNIDPENIKKFRTSQEPLLRERINIILILGALLVPFFGWLDYLLYPEFFKRFLAYRLFASLCCTVLYLLNRKYYRGARSSYLGITAFYIVGLIIIAMILDTGGYDSSYYAGLNLVFLGFCTVLPLHPRILTFHCIVLYIVYVASVLMNNPVGPFFLFLGNNLFVIGTLAIAIIASLVNHRLRLKEYLLRDELGLVQQKLKAYSKSLENTVEESEEKYRLVVDHANDAIFILQDQVITFPNPKARELLGYTEEELLNISLLDLVSEEDRPWIVEKCYRIQEHVDFPSVVPFRITSKRGDVIWVDMGSVPIRWMGREASLHFLRDVTERKKLELELIQAQKMEAMGTLAGGIAHDFNNLLQVILGFLQLVLMKKTEDDPDYQSLTQIEISARRAAELTKQLLLYGRKVDSELKPIDLNVLVQRVSTLLERVIPKMIFIDVRLAEDLKGINGDPTQIEQIIMNLVVNARDAMTDGGTITIETRNIAIDAAFCERHADLAPGQYALLTVSDTGHGMSQETQERIFDPFYTTKEKGKGTGLGLAIVYSIVKSHQGAIICQSTLNQGTRFDIYLPVTPEVVLEGDGEGIRDESYQGHGETILFVDDDRDLFQLTRDMLEVYNYRTVSAETGEEALEIYQKEGNQIDLIILDLNMPGMGGAKCLERLVEIDPSIKIIIATGYMEQGQKEALLRAGASAYITKPYQFQTVLKEIKALLSREARPSGRELG